MADIRVYMYIVGYGIQENVQIQRRRLLQTLAAPSSITRISSGAAFKPSCKTVAKKRASWHGRVCPSVSVNKNGKNSAKLEGFSCNVILEGVAGVWRTNSL